MKYCRYVFIVDNIKMCIGFQKMVSLSIFSNKQSHCYSPHLAGVLFFSNDRVLFMVYKHSRWLTAPLQVIVVYSLS